MKKIIVLLLNLVSVVFVALLAIAVATLGMTKKVNDYRATQILGIVATVEKQNVPIIAYSRGVVKQVNVKTGEQVKKGQQLIIMDNPALKSKIEALDQYPNNVSAQTESKVAKEELKNLQIYSPIDGAVGDIYISAGSTVESLTKLMLIFSNQDVKILSLLTPKQYQLIQQRQKVKAYNQRLSQEFEIIPNIVKPNVADPKDKADTKKISIYFILKNASDGASLLDNEDLSLKLEEDEQKVYKPVDYFIDFWNGLISKDKLNDNK